MLEVVSYCCSYMMFVFVSYCCYYCLLRVLLHEGGGVARLGVELLQHGDRLRRSGLRRLRVDVFSSSSSSSSSSRSGAATFATSIQYNHPYLAHKPGFHALFICIVLYVLFTVVLVVDCMLCLPGFRAICGLGRVHAI